MENFNFLDYLNYMAKNVIDSPAAQNTLKEIGSIKGHTATIAIMQKHIKQFQSVKKLILCGIQMNIN